jgi:hypothetical protein
MRNIVNELEYNWEFQVYRVLAIGCSEHPSYRAKRKPTAECEKCMQLWDFSQELTARFGRKWWV